MENKIEIIVGGRNHSKSMMAKAFNDFYREHPELPISELMFGKLEDIDHIEVTDEEIKIGWDKLQKRLEK